MNKLIVCWYFSFTTLSTTGFGDYHPKSDAERFFAAFYMLFGVAVFSHTTANYIVIIEKMNKIDEDIGEGDQLILFFATLKYYNKNQTFNIKMKECIEEYFEFRWSNDRNAAISSKRDQQLLAELPHEVQDRLLCGYLFTDFLQTFRSFFSLKRDSKFGGGIYQHNKLRIASIYTWSHRFYRDFMVDLMRMLEPWFHLGRQTIKSELDQFGELIFVIQGVVALGFEINKTYSMCKKFENNCVIGAYGLTFNQRAAYSYRAVTYCKGYFVRKAKWRDLLEDNPEIAVVLKHHILLDYLMNVRAKVELKKKNMKKLFQKRADHQMILFSDNKFEKLKVYEQLYQLQNKDPQANQRQQPDLHDPAKRDDHSCGTDRISTHSHNLYCYRTLRNSLDE